MTGLLLWNHFLQPTATPLLSASHSRPLPTLIFVSKEAQMWLLETHIPWRRKGKTHSFKATRGKTHSFFLFHGNSEQSYEPVLKKLNHVFKLYFLTK